jgi:outer membrane protein TolC
MSLQQVITFAQARSGSAVQARNRFRASYWQFRTQRAAFLPTLSLSATAPDLTRNLSRIPLPDGSEAFIRQSFVSSSARLAIGKTIGTTGGEVFMETALERLQLLDGGRTTSYLSRPVTIGLRQPLFGFNTYAWQDRIEPLRFEEARREYAEELEGIAISAAQNFFDLMSAQDQLAGARNNVRSTDTLYSITSRRYAAGQTTEYELLQTHLAQLNARLELQRAELDVRARTYSLRSYLGLRDTADVRPEITFDVPDVTADVPTAVAQARANRADGVGFERRTLEAKREVAEARASSGRAVSLFATFGLSQSTSELGSVYHRGQENDQATLGFEVPILDWGRARARTSLAESNRDVALQSVDQARQDMDQDVTMKALQFNVQRERIRIAATADEIAARGYASAQERYLAGHADAQAVNLAQVDKDAARRSHVDALRGYWIAYYELRRATLYDFGSREPIPINDPAE